MLSRRTELMIGLGVVALAAFILWVLIPAYVMLPRRPPMMALAPSFWPRIICWMMLIGGAILTARAALAPPPPDSIIEEVGASRGELQRLGALAAILVGTYVALPVIGMVWTYMAVFILLVLMTRRSNFILGILVGVALPLVLYMFFTKVAGVAVPQGQFVRLP